jgi:structure-specific recognition protein 1
VRLFVLPKSNSPHTLLVVSLDPPIRKGQTYYPHILCQFPTDDELSVELDISPEMLAAKNEKVCGGRQTDRQTRQGGPWCCHT